MAHTCNVESCTRFSVVQWMIGAGLAIMLATQGYLINRIDRIETMVTDHMSQSAALEWRVTSLEDIHEGELTEHK